MAVERAAQDALHLIWDFDGTLYDAYPRMTDDLVAALAQFGVAADTGEVYRLIKQTLFFGAVTLAARHGLDDQELLAAFRKLHKTAKRLPPMPGLKACLADTSALNCRHYLFTHRDRGAVEMLREDGLDVFFSDYVTRERRFADKPSPEAILYLMEKHGFRAQDAYMIGDRDIDILAGQAAGAAGILLDPDGFYPALSVEHRVHSLAEIPAITRARLARA
jgi:HAD superfamily hydrolase (TIGR01549 family)